MPNGDTVQIQMPDGRILTGPRSGLPTALKMGAKLYDPSKQEPKESTLTQVGRGAALGTMSGLGIPETQTPVKDFFKQFARVPSKGEFIERAFDPTGGALTSLPGIVKNLKGSIEEGAGITGTNPEEVAHGVASTLAQLLTLAGAGKAGDMEVGGKSMAREFMGVADKDIEPAIRESYRKASEAHAKYRSDLADAQAEHAEKVAKITKENQAATDEHTAAMDKARQDYEAKVKNIEQENQKTQQEYERQIQEAKDKASSKIASRQSKTVEASKAQTASETRQAALVTKRGPVFQRLSAMADKAQANVQDVDTKVRALEGAKWNALKRQVGNTPVDWTPVQQAVVDAEKNILQGSPENIAIFRNIMKEGEGAAPSLADASVFKGRPGVDVKEFLSSIKDPVKRDQFVREMQSSGAMSSSQTGVPAEGATVPFDTARGFYTEFGEKLAGRSLPSDVRRALKYVQDAADKQIMNSVAKAGGKSAALEYQQLKSNWRDYMQTFYDNDSPIRKLKEGKDPGDKLNPITGDEGERAIKLFGKYRDLGADVQSLGRIRALQKQLRSLSSTSKSVPSGDISIDKPKEPTMKEEPRSADIPRAPELKKAPKFKASAVPTDRPLTAEEARKAKLTAAAKSYAHPPSRWDMMFPPLHVYRLALKNLLQSESFRDWLSRGGGPQVPSQ